MVELENESARLLIFNTVWRRWICEFLKYAYIKAGITIWKLMHTVRAKWKFNNFQHCISWHFAIKVGEQLSAP